MSRRFTDAAPRMSRSDDVIGRWTGEKAEDSIKTDDQLARNGRPSVVAEFEREAETAAAEA
jgi:hypothetical protein